MKRFTILPWLVAMALVSGCGDSGSPDSSAAGGGHKHASVHGGTAVELGSHESQLDVVFDPVEGKLRAWVMSAHMDSFVRIPAKSIEIAAQLPSGETILTLEPAANLATGEKPGDASLFEVQADALKGVPGFDAKLLPLSVRGKTYSNVVFRAGQPNGGAAKP